MLHRVLLAIAAAALVVTACGSESTGSADARFLRYSYEPASRLVYDVESVLFMDTTASGLPEGADMSLAMEATQVLDYVFAEGPTPGTVEITIHQSLTGGSGSVTALGSTEYLSPADLGVTDSEIVIVLDELGTVIEAAFDGTPIPLDLLGESAGFGANAFNQPQHAGPVLPDHAVGVGDVWKTEETFDALGFAVTQKSRHEVTAEEERDGRLLMVVQSDVTFKGTKVDLVDMLAGLAASGYEEPGMSAAELEEALAMLERSGVEMTLELERSESEMTTWFDPDAGVAAYSNMEIPAVMTLRMSGIPELPGEVEVEMSMELEQQATLRRVSD